MRKVKDLKKKLTQSKNKQEPDIIRLMFVNLELSNSKDGRQFIEKSYNYSNPYQIPEGMTLDEACKVVSFVASHFEDKFNIKVDSFVSPRCVGDYLEKLQFTKLTEPKEFYSNSELSIYMDEKINFNAHQKGIIDLITFKGDESVFNRTDLKNHYFDWYTKDVTLEELTAVYQRINAQKPNIEIIDNDTTIPTL